MLVKQNLWFSWSLEFQVCNHSHTPSHRHTQGYLVQSVALLEATLKKKVEKKNAIIYISVLHDIVSWFI